MAWELQLDAVRQVAALFCPDLFGLLAFVRSVHVTLRPQKKNKEAGPDRGLGCIHCLLLSMAGKQLMGSTCREQ